jgi:succinyl-CoA synthetase beta subunit
MNIHEYQAKQILKGFGVPVLAGGVAYTAEEAEKVAQGLPAGVYVVKSQIHAGGRGKGTFKEAAAGGKGGVRVVKSIAEVKENAKQMLGNTLVTHQSGSAGKVVKRVYIETGCNIKRELYLSMLVDRGSSRVTIMASTEGGVNIEEVAEKSSSRASTRSPASRASTAAKSPTHSGSRATKSSRRPSFCRRFIRRSRKAMHPCSRSIRWS